jgi:hypothetical protein
MNRVLWVALVLATAAVPAGAEQKKEAWMWTLDQRLTARFDPAMIRERDEAYVALHPQLRSYPVRPLSANELRYRIDGGRNPELFLPHELFDYLLRDGFDTDPERRSKNRAAVARLLCRAGFDPDGFWPKLESVSGIYLALRTREIRSRAEATDRCRARYEALSAAHELFGSEQFHRMLYSAVAPNVQFSIGTSTFRDPAERLRNEAGGCHETQD